MANSYKINKLDLTDIGSMFIQITAISVCSNVLYALWFYRTLLLQINLTRTCKNAYPIIK